jgi:hypothetical protein
MPCVPERQSLLDAYQADLVEYKMQHPDADLSDANVKKGLADNFKIRYHIWKPSEKIEKSGAEKYINGDFSMVDGKMKFNEGSTAESFGRRQQISADLNSDPSKFSAPDHQTSILIQEAILHGATEVATVFGREGDDNRDIVHYIYDPVTNRG